MSTLRSLLLLVLCLSRSSNASAATNDHGMWMFSADELPVVAKAIEAGLAAGDPEAGYQALGDKAPRASVKDLLEGMWKPPYGNEHPRVKAEAVVVPIPLERALSHSAEGTFQMAFMVFLPDQQPWTFQWSGGSPKGLYQFGWGDLQSGLRYVDLEIAAYRASRAKSRYLIEIAQDHGAKEPDPCYARTRFWQRIDTFASTKTLDPRTLLFTASYFSQVTKTSFWNSPERFETVMNAMHKLTHPEGVTACYAEGIYLVDPTTSAIEHLGYDLLIDEKEWNALLAANPHPKAAPNTVAVAQTAYAFLDGIQTESATAMLFAAPARANRIREQISAHFHVQLPAPGPRDKAPKPNDKAVNQWVVCPRKTSATAYSDQDRGMALFLQLKDGHWLVTDVVSAEDAGK